jgi:radical SAM superfamily enzyme YgiQ (UPF0313 family)
MKILMINSNRYKVPLPVMPYGLCCVAAAVEEAGYEAKILDLCFSKNCRRDIVRTIDEFHPDIIGISIRNIDTAAPYNTLFLVKQVKREVIDPIKKAFSGPIVIGGPSVGISGAEMLSFFDLEFAIGGDGEAAMVEFIRRIEKRVPLNGMAGLIWQKNGQVIEENHPMRVTDLDALPSPDYHRYTDIPTYRKYKSPIQIQTKRGCALKCTYCTYNTIEGHHVRLRDPQRVADEIETMVKETGINIIEFTDSTFNIPLDHAKSVLRAIIAKKLDVGFQTMGLNPGAIDEELAQLMKRANFIEFQVGVESGCNVTLRSLGKNFRKDDVLRAAKYLHAVDLPIMWWVLTGAPGETEETLKETFETIHQAASKGDLVVVGNGIRVYKGSPIAKRMLRENRNCTNDNFFLPTAYSPKGLNLQMIRLINKRISFKYSNFMFFDEVQRVPFFLINLQSKLMNRFAPRVPWWKTFLFMASLQKKLGITALKRRLFEFKNRRLLYAVN